MNKLSLLLICSLLICKGVFAQKTEYGFFVGSSGYFGDVGYENAEKILAHQSPAIGFIYKKNTHDYLSFRTSIQAGKIKATDDWATNSTRKSRGLSFESSIIDFNLGFEFNFFKFSTRKRKTTYSPYLFAGISAIAFNPKVMGTQIELQPLGTEGQGTNLPNTQKKYNRYALAIPFGFGYKMNVSKKWSIGLEWTWRSAQTDYLDDVSTVYINPNSLSTDAAEWSNPSGIEITNGKSRGNKNNNDWYNFTGITFSYKIRNKPNKCPKALLP
jgi:hypothetical protein